MTVVTETGKNYSTGVCGTHVLVLRTRVQVWSLLITVCVITRSVGGLHPDTKYRKLLIFLSI